MSRTPPKPDADLPAKRLAANPHDHVARFLSEEFVLGAGHVKPSALYKAYELWCLARSVLHRALTPVMLLDHLKEVYGIAPKEVTHIEDDEERAVRAVVGLQFKHDASLNSRLAYSLTPHRKAMGSVPRKPSRARTAREYYQDNKPEILAKARERRRQKKEQPSER